MLVPSPGFSGGPPIQSAVTASRATTTTAAATTAAATTAAATTAAVSTAADTAARFYGTDDSEYAAANETTNADYAAVDANDWPESEPDLTHITQLDGNASYSSVSSTKSSN